MVKFYCSIQDKVWYKFFLRTLLQSLTGQTDLLAYFDSWYDTLHFLRNYYCLSVSSDGSVLTPVMQRIDRIDNQPHA